MRRGLTGGIGCVVILLLFGVFFPILWFLIPFAVLGGLVSPYLRKEMGR